MNEPIVSIDHIRRSAAKAFASRNQPAECPYPEDSEARAAWLKEYRTLHSTWAAMQLRRAA
jgi:hypothetical protein